MDNLEDSDDDKERRVAEKRPPPRAAASADDDDDEDEDEEESEEEDLGPGGIDLRRGHSEDEEEDDEESDEEGYSSKRSRGGRPALGAGGKRASKRARSALAQLVHMEAESEDEGKPMAARARWSERQMKRRKKRRSICGTHSPLTVSRRVSTDCCAGGWGACPSSVL